MIFHIAALVTTYEGTQVAITIWISKSERKAQTIVRFWLSWLVFPDYSIYDGLSAHPPSLNPGPYQISIKSETPIG